MNDLVTAHIVKYAVPKQAEPPKMCQDACETNNRRMLYAVADGVSRSFYAGEWATLLVDHFCYSDPTLVNNMLFAQHAWMDWLIPIQDEWQERIGKIIETRDGLPVDITNRFKLREPAASTFIGLQLIDDDPSSYGWRAVVIGDSVLFHLRQGSLHGAYQVKRSSDFNSYPEYFASFAESNMHVPTFFNGDALPEDRFLLVTDGLASWLLKQHERGLEGWDKAWKTLCAVGNWDEFHKLVRRQQSDRKNPLANDDVALVAVSILSGSSKQDDYPLSTFSESIKTHENEAFSSAQEWEVLVPLQKPFTPRLSGRLTNIKSRLAMLRRPLNIEVATLFMAIVAAALGGFALTLVLIELFTGGDLSNWLAR